MKLWHFGVLGAPNNMRDTMAFHLSLEDLKEGLSSRSRQLFGSGFKLKRADFYLKEERRFC